MLHVIGGAAAVLVLIVTVVLTVSVLRRKRNVQCSDSDLNKANRKGSFGKDFTLSDSQVIFLHFFVHVKFKKVYMGSLLEILKL